MYGCEPRLPQRGLVWDSPGSHRGVQTSSQEDNIDITVIKNSTGSGLTHTNAYTYTETHIHTKHLNTESHTHTQTHTCM